MALFNTNRAYFFDAKGTGFVGKKGFRNSVKTFEFNGGSYNVDDENASSWEQAVFPPPLSWIWHRTNYIYNVEISNPALISKWGKPPISPRLYNINLKTNVAEQLNNLANKGIMQFLTMRNILIGAGILLGYLYLTHKI